MLILELLRVAYKYEQLESVLQIFKGNITYLETNVVVSGGVFGSEIEWVVVILFLAGWPASSPLGLVPLVLSRLGARYSVTKFV